eukprot:TRINITY_DN134_c0_g1_i5.p1 TRINITY_DN134_c0_g1~~TRINITY_DN134_c0_g1_i5.p1  ORF type:complete len:825 (-),score=124.49 TRINITY_DN134_c0_g1_i5:504-2978(-)
MVWIKPQSFSVVHYGRPSQYAELERSHDGLFALYEYRGSMPRSKFVVLMLSCVGSLASSAPLSSATSCVVAESDDRTCILAEWKYACQVLPTLLATATANNTATASGDDKQWMLAHFKSLAQKRISTSTGEVEDSRQSPLPSRRPKSLSFAGTDAHGVVRAALVSSAPVALNKSADSLGSSTSSLQQSTDTLCSSDSDAEAEAAVVEQNDQFPQNCERHLYSVTVEMAQHFNRSGTAAAGSTGLTCGNAYWPQERHCHSAVVYDSENAEAAMYVFGGYSNHCYLRDFCSFNFLTRIWKKLPTRGSPSARHSHSAVVYGDAMYVFGGVGSGDQLNDLYRYSFVRKNWKQVRYEGDPPSRRWGHTAVCRGGSMYIFGGYGASYNNDLAKYCFETKTWQVVTAFGVVPYPRHFHSASLGKRGTMVVIGGFAGGNYHDMCTFDLVNNTWTVTNLPRVVASIRGHTTTAVHLPVTGEALAVPFLVTFGGRSKHEPLGAFYTFDPDTETWATVCLKGPLPTARYFHTCVVQDNSLWIFGGLGYASLPVANSTPLKPTNLSDLMQITLQVERDSTGALVCIPAVQHHPPAVEAPEAAAESAVQHLHVPIRKNSDIQDITLWLEELGLGSYVQTFIDEEITIATLPALTEDDLKELGVKMGARKHVLAATAKMKQLGEAHLHNVKIVELVAAGAHGAVYHGIWQDSIHVAMKQIFSNTDDAFQREVSVLQSLRHPNCVFYLGIFEESPEKRFICTEFLPLGSLDKFLRSSGASLSFDQLLLLGVYVAAGMKYLSEKLVVHRDLAARNVLVKQEGADYIAKGSGLYALSQTFL